MLRRVNTARALHQQVRHIRVQHVQRVLLLRPLEHRVILFPLPLQETDCEDLAVVLGAALIHVDLEPRQEVHPLAEEGDLVPELLLEAQVELLRVDGLAMTSLGGR